MNFLTLVIAVVVQVVYILALKDIRVGTNKLLADNDPNGPFKTLHKGVTSLYYMAWIGLIITLLGLCAAVSSTLDTQRRMKAIYDSNPSSPVVTAVEQENSPSTRKGE